MFFHQLVHEIYVWNLDVIKSTHTEFQGVGESTVQGYWHYSEE